MVLLDFIDANPKLVLTFIIVLAVFLLMFIIHQVRKRIFNFFKRKNSSNVKKLIKLEHPLILIIVILGVQAIIGTYLRDYSRIHTNINNLLISLCIIIVTYMLAIIGALILDNWSKKLKRSRHDETHEGIVPLLKSVINILLGFIALIFVLQAWNIAVGTLLTSLGIAGVILGFAFKDTLTNVFGGIALILDDTFRKGELIELPDGELGFVIETSLRSTKIKNFDLEEIYVPNSVLSNMKIKNYSQPSKSIRIKVALPVAIGTDVDRVEKLVFELLDKRADVLKYPRPKFFFIKIADYYLDLSICFFIRDYHDLFVVKSDISKEMYNLLLRNKIEIPYPARTIYRPPK